MANRKQDGSNISQLEYCTGACPVQCELCFVNFGMNGRSVPKSLDHPNNAKWKEKATKEGQKTGLWYPGSPFMIPVAEPYKGLAKKREPSIKIEFESKKYLTAPVFIRVGSMSDCSLVPSEWLDFVLKTWGDYCFFNSSIKAIKMHPNNLEHFHKLVVTTNPGHQNYKNSRTLKAFGKQGPMDFLHPKTLTDIGFGEFENIIKFYRLRTLPTYIPRLKTDKPVVATQLRFKSIDSCILWCQKYKFDLELAGDINKSAKTLAEEYGVKIQKAKMISAVIRSRTGLFEPAEFNWRKSALWPTYDVDMPFVCNREDGACAACGLCATLDGTEKDNRNPLNRVSLSTGKIIENWSWKKNQNSYFATSYTVNGDYFEEALFDSLSSDGIFQNPAEALSDDEIESALIDCANYILQGETEITTGNFYCEGWSTESTAKEYRNLALWSLAARYGMAGYDRLRKICLANTIPEGLFGDRKEFADILSGDHPACLSFGKVG